MKNPQIFIIFITSLLISSCCKLDTLNQTVPNLFVQFTGKWVPIEYIVNGKPTLGPFSGTGFFGAYDDSFEVIDTSGFYYPAIYINDEFNSSYPKKGQLLYNFQSNKVSFNQDNLVWTSGSVEKINDKELWILNDKGSLLKLKKI